MDTRSTVLRRDAYGAGVVETPASPSSGTYVANVEYVRKYVSSISLGNISADDLSKALALSFRLQSTSVLSGVSGLPSGYSSSDIGKSFIVQSSSGSRIVYTWAGQWIPLGADVSGFVSKDGSKQLSTEDFTTALKTKLDGLPSSLDGYVLKEDGKQLSANDFTDELKEKLEGLSSSTVSETRFDALADSVSELSSAVQSNSSSISSLSSGISDLRESKADSSDVDSLESSVSSLATSVSSVSSDIASLKASTESGFSEDESRISALENSFSSIAGHAQTPVAPTSSLYVGKPADAGYTYDALSKKVDKVAGKGLSTNDFSDAYMALVAGAVQSSALFDSSGTIASDLLPSYVDDVIEASSYGSLPEEGEGGKIYVTTDDNRSYRWSGSQYVEISSGVDFSTILSDRTYNLGDPGAFFQMVVDIARVLGATVNVVGSSSDSTLGSVASSVLGTYDDDSTIGALQTAKGLPDESTLGSLL